MGFDWLPAKNYKRHYICLNCQKGFKRASEKDMKQPVSVDLSNLMSAYYASDLKQDIVSYINLAHQKLDVSCPNCQHLMLQVHYNFEVPAQRDSKAWKKLRETSSADLMPNYEIYIRWHRLEIQKTTANSVKLKMLQQNLKSLEKNSKN